MAGGTGSRLHDAMRGLKPSHRNELEITDVNNFYLEQGSYLARVHKDLSLVDDAVHIMQK